MADFKQVIIDGEPTHYIIFRDGWIVNYKNHQWSQGTASNGYVRYSICINGKTKSVSKHRLLAQNFIENDDPEHKNIVHHIDGNIYNNELSNLEWTTQKENVNKRVNVPIPKAFDNPLTEEEIEKERWIENYPVEGYAISDLGRKKNLRTGQISMGSINKISGYVRWNFYQANIELQAHRAVYQAFHPDEKIDTIDHINGIRNDNRLSNLRNVTQADNVRAFLANKGMYCVAQLNDEQNIIAVYSSASEAERTLADPQTHTSVGQISHAIRTHKKALGYFWRKITKEECQKFVEVS